MPENTPSDGRPPHVVLITCHDLGRHLGCYGVDTVQSQSIDALAGGGTRFTRAFATAPSCSQSRSALATGRYPHANGVMGLAHPPFAWEVGAGERHIAQLLGAAGYQAHLFGLQHLTANPARLGFGHLHGFDVATGCHERALGAGVADRCTAFLATAPADVPLYIEINLEEPHRPYDQGGATRDDERGVSLPGYLPDDEASREEMAMLQGAIRQADRAVGRILSAVDARLGANTLVVFTADHGLAMPRAKCTLYDPGIEVALLMRWPVGGLAGGRTIDGMISNVDVVPTLLESAGAPLPANLQGSSLFPLLRGEPAATRTEVFAEKTFHSYYDPMRAIRTARYKLIRNFEAAFQVEVPSDVQRGAIFRRHAELYSGAEHPPLEMYDLDADPLETTNLAGQAGWRKVELELDSRLHSWMEATEDPLLRGPVPSPAWRGAMVAWRLPGKS